VELRVSLPFGGRKTVSLSRFFSNLEQVEQNMHRLYQKCTTTGCPER